MANFINFLEPITTGAPNSHLIGSSQVKAEPLEGVFKPAAPPLVGQLYPRGIPTQR